MAVARRDPNGPLSTLFLITRDEKLPTPSGAIDLRHLRPDAACLLKFHVCREIYELNKAFLFAAKW